jgi:hypothetical protein
MGYWRGTRDDVMTRKGQSSRFKGRAEVKEEARHRRRANDRHESGDHLIAAYIDHALDPDTPDSNEEVPDADR